MARLTRMRLGCGILAAVVLALACRGWTQETRLEEWRPATDAELRSVIPARAPVVQERIETEMRSASGITNGRGKYIAGVVLITAGYSAEGKYSHYFLTQVPLKIGSDVRLVAGQYLLGYEHGEDGLLVHFFEAASGKPVGSVLAKLIPGNTRVESFRVWPPQDRSAIQIGRFGFSYQIGG
ncbi:MAG TPA: hypothetical protein VHZ09_17180 [Acidobacteriaceae bacterium]|nr:hypothetical protein [Acidobacteriaceae bacterium]